MSKPITYTAPQLVRRIEQKLSRYQIAKKTDIDQSVLSRLVNGRQKTVSDTSYRALAQLAYDEKVL